MDEGVRAKNRSVTRPPDFLNWAVDSRWDFAGGTHRLRACLIDPTRRSVGFANQPKMGCAASTGLVSKPNKTNTASDGEKGNGKKKDAETTYRERLGEDFMKEFARSQDAIRQQAQKPAPRSPGSSQASNASTHIYEETFATGTQISPYTTPPKSSLPVGSAEAHACVSGLDAQGTAHNDTSGPYISSGKESKARIRTGGTGLSSPGSRES